MRSRYQIISNLNFWSLDIGKIIAMYETYTDKEVLLMKVKTCQNPKITFHFKHNDISYYFLALIYDNNVYIHLNGNCSQQNTIESLLPNTIDNWITKVSKYPICPVSIWDSYSMAMQKFLDNVRRHLDEMEYIQQQRKKNKIKKKKSKLTK